MFRSLLVVVFLTAVAVQAEAQPGNPKTQISAERLELLRLWKLVDELEIDEEQAQKVFPVWSRHRRQRNEVRADLRRVAGALEKLLEADEADEDGLLERIDEMRRLKLRVAEMETAMTEELTKLLTVEQRARYLLFDQRFRGDLMAIIRGMHGREGRGMPGGAGPMRGERMGMRWGEQ